MPRFVRTWTQQIKLFIFPLFIILFTVSVLGTGLVKLRAIPMRKVQKYTMSSSLCIAGAKYLPLQLGLTGSIGMGKSTIANQFLRLGFRVFDADKEVHRLYSKDGKAVEPMAALYPDVIVDGTVDRSRLMEKIMKEPTVLKKVEAIVHPLVIDGRREFFAQAHRDGEFLVVYDIPLLFENRSQYDLDYILVVSASPETQRQRVLSRANMSPEKFASILGKQVPDEVKRKQADFIVITDYPGYAEGKAQVAHAIESIINQNPEQWNHWNSRRIKSCTEVVPEKSANGGIRSALDMVVFDLDDTLVPTAQQIPAAVSALRAFMERHMPGTHRLSSQDMSQLMRKVHAEQPLLQHDLTELRRLALRAEAEKHGEEQYVDQAIDVFVQARSDVSAHLYADSVACCEWLRAQGLQVALLTNGNAVLSLCSNPLAPLLSLTLGAGDVGANKPSPVGFMACAQRAGLLSGRMLFVGDSYAKDVQGARRCGMHTALLLREEQSAAAQGGHTNTVERSVKATSTENQVESETLLRGRYPEADMVLQTLQPREFEAKLLEYLTRKLHS